MNIPEAAQQRRHRRRRATAPLFYREPAPQGAGKSKVNGKKNQ
jgi:hypothetical protein